MIQIHSNPEPFTAEYVKLQMDRPDLDFSTAGEMAKAHARQLNKDAMLLSWYCSETGDFAPKFECGYTEKPPWVVFAESRGANLTIDVNDGQYIFMYLKL